jgi:hypothetical protein
MRAERRYLEDYPTEPMLAEQILSAMDDTEFPDVPRKLEPVVREYQMHLGTGQVIKLDDLETGQHLRLTNLVRVGSATVTTHALYGPVARGPELEKDLLADWPAAEEKHGQLQRHSAELFVTYLARDLIGPRSVSFQWYAPLKIKATNVVWFFPEKQKEEESETQINLLSTFEAQTDSTRSVWNRYVLRHLVAIRNTLKLMALILWNSLRHPLSEGVIDFDRVTVYDKSVDSQNR